LARDVDSTRQESIDQFVRLALVARALTGTLDADELVDMVIRQGMAGLDADGGVVAMLESDNLLTPIATFGYSNSTIAASAPLRLDRDLPITTAVRENTSVWVTSREDAYTRFPEFASVPTNSHAWMAVPLVANGRVIGALGVSFLAPRRFSEEERLFISALADLTALNLATRATAAGEHLPRSLETTQSEPQSRQSLDRAIKNIFASSFGIATQLNKYTTDDDSMESLHDVLHRLETAARECRLAAFTMLIDGQQTTLETATQFEQALTSRATIDQAKGILMARHQLSEDEAFDALRERSQRANRKLRLIAQEVVDSTQRPLPPDERP